MAKAKGLLPWISDKEYSEKVEELTRRWDDGRWTDQDGFEYAFVITGNGSVNLTPDSFLSY